MGKPKGVYFDEDMTVAVCGDCGARVERTRDNPYPEPPHKRTCVSRRVAPSNRKRKAARR